MKAPARPASRRATRKAAAERATARADGATIRPAAGFNFGDDIPTRPLRVAIYIRISTDEEHQPFSLEAQETKLRSYIEIQPGWELVGPIYRDEKSGATLERPALQRALTAAKAGRFDILLVYRVDRLARSLRGLVDILDQLDAAEVGFRSATEPVDTSTAVGRMLVQMLGVFAQFERETIIDRVINGMERKAAKGEWCGGYRPHGYELDRDTGKLVPVDGEDKVPAMIFNMYVRERLGARAVGTRLNERGLRTKAGNPWNAEAVLTVLRNRVYLGETTPNAPTSTPTTPWPVRSPACTAASGTSAPPPPASSTVTATTPATPASGTAPTRAPPNGYPQTRLSRQSSAPWWTPTGAPT